MSGDLSPHHLSLNSSYVLVYNLARVDAVDVFIHYDFLSIPFPYRDSWKNQAALELRQ
jgi:hypothetical protein